jgi:phytoene synthase
VIAVVSLPARPLQLDDASAEIALAAKGRTFHWARRFLPPEQARRATRLYGICRQLDDLADEGAHGNLDAQQTFDQLRAGLTRSRTGLSADPDALMTRFGFELDPLVVHALIDGLATDLSTVAVDTEAELLRYAYRVAGTVGLMMCRALDVTDPRAGFFAIDLGIAMQLTNICRDVRGDAEMGRRYLPRSLVGDLQAEALICPDNASRPRITAAVGALLTLADRYYRSAQQGLVYLPRSARLAIAVAAQLYRAIGIELRSHGCRYWQCRTVVPRAEKARLTAKALATTELLPTRWVRTPTHEQSLHAALAGLPRVDTGVPT